MRAPRTQQVKVGCNTRRDCIRGFRTFTFALAEAIRAGIEIGPLSVSVALRGLREGTLAQVLPGAHLRPNNIYALYASRRYLDARIGTFVGFLRDAVPRRIAEQEQELRDWSVRQKGARAKVHGPVGRWYRTLSGLDNRLTGLRNVPIVTPR